MNQFTVTKGTIECYRVRSTTPGLYWADITIDAQGRGGRISIASDYGKWSNYWGAAGDDFKAFLGEISFDYAADKFGVEDWANVEETIKYLKTLVLETRRQEGIDACQAREVFNDVLSLEDSTRQSIALDINSTQHLGRFLYDQEVYDLVMYEKDPLFVRFWNELWPVLLAEFEREREPVAA